MSTPNKFTLSPLTVPLNDKRHYAIRDGIYMTQLKWCWHNKCFIEHWAIYCSTKIVRIQSVNPACGEGECIKLESNKLNYRERECLVYVNGKVVNLHNDICTPSLFLPAAYVTHDTINSTLLSGDWDVLSSTWNFPSCCCCCLASAPKVNVTHTFFISEQYNSGNFFFLLDSIFPLRSNEFSLYDINI